MSEEVNGSLQFHLRQRCDFQGESMPEPGHPLRIVVLVHEEGDDDERDSDVHGFMNAPQPTMRNETEAPGMSEERLLWDPFGSENIWWDPARDAFPFILPNELEG